MVNKFSPTYKVFTFIKQNHDLVGAGGFIAQLVRALHRYREVTGSNLVEVLNFFGLLTQLHKLRSLMRGSFFI